MTIILVLAAPGLLLTYPLFRKGAECPALLNAGGACLVSIKPTDKTVRLALAEVECRCFVHMHENPEVRSVKFIVAFLRKEW